MGISDILNNLLGHLSSHCVEESKMGKAHYIKEQFDTFNGQCPRSAVWQIDRIVVST